MEKYFYKLYISYDGQRYSGWQIQKETELTVQGKLNQAFWAVTNISNFKTVGSGRTDAGVHALGQVVLLEVDKKLPNEVFIKGVNQRLPSDIRVNRVESTDADFHPIFSAKSKVYQYVLSLHELPPFLSENFLAYSRAVNLDVLNSGICCFRGKHDFLNYYCVGTEVKTTVREIYNADVSFINCFEFNHCSVNGNFLKIEFEGSGFLKQQVRLMVGALLSLNEGKISISDLQNSLRGNKVKHLAPVAPSAGLYLHSVKY